MEAAADLFATSGNTTVRDIAKRAGVNHALVHYYFGSKEQLKREAFDHIADHEATIAALEAAASPEALVEVYAESLTRDPRMGAMAMLDMLEEEPVLISGRQFPTTAKLVELLVPSNPALSQQLASFMVLNLGTLEVLKEWLDAFTGRPHAELLEMAKAWHAGMIRDARAGRLD